MTAFEEMGIMPEIGRATEEVEWLLPTNIQSEAIPLILGGGDVLMAAETGSGKTGAFSLPVLQAVWESLHLKTSVKEDPHRDKWVFSGIDLDANLSLSTDCLSAQSRTQNWQGVRANKGVKKIHFSGSGLARIGWSLENASLELGTDRFGWGFGGTAKKSFGKNFEDYGQKFGDKFDIVGCIIDLDRSEISFSKNGQELGVAFRLPQNLSDNNCFYPTICTKNAGVTAKFLDSSSAPLGCQWVGSLGSDQFVINSVSGSGKDCGNSSGKSCPKAVILEPSRELAEQTHNCISNFKKHLAGDVRQCLLVGGTSARDQIQQLDAGVDIVCGTIGRVNELIQNGNLSLKSCRFFIIDEVDAFLAQGNMNIILQLHSKIPRMSPNGRRLQMIVCSATLHNFDVKKLAEKIMFFPIWVDLKGEDSVPDTVHHVVVRVDPRKDQGWINLKRQIKTDGVHANDRLNPFNLDAECLSEAIKVLKGEYVLQAIDKLNIDSAIIFCRTKIDCDNLEQFLLSVGQSRNVDYSCVCLHGDRSPQERTANLEAFKRKECKFLLCTDVAARGIDVSGIPYVIQVTLPDDKANYLHRIGRVGRAEKMGLAVSFVANVPEKVWFHSNCRSKGKNCWNTKLVERGGCCIWYNELQLLADIEEHLKCTIQEIDGSYQLKMDEFDGKVVYGDKVKSSGYDYKDHVKEMVNDVQQLNSLEKKAQLFYLNRTFV